MKLEPLTKEQCEQARIWRNQDLGSMRTPFLLTKETQEDFYRNVICNRNSPHRCYGIWLEPHGEEPRFIGMCGITHIQWENRLGEISLIVDPEMRDKGYGKQIVSFLLDQAFNYLNLKTICGECYLCNPGVQFWQRICEDYKCTHPPVVLPRRKFWQGTYFAAEYFTITEDDYRKAHSPL